MRIYRGLPACMALSVVVLAAGCRSASDPQEVLHSVVFPNEWVGDIDKTGVNEPSGICWHAQRKTLFVVGDEGDIYEMMTDGAPIKQKRIREADFEGVTYDPATGLLYIAIEEEESVLEIHPETFEVLREFALPRDFRGRTLLRAGGEGIEGITFVPDSKHPQGGVFYVANQAFTLSDEQDISAVFQVELPIRTQTGGARIVGYFEPGIIDLSGLHYEPTTDRILVISDATNLILEYSRDHHLINVQAFPGDNQEGVTVDSDGFIYIAQDTGGIIKLKWLR
jgi:uncharacterized protein YjiK